MQNRNSYIDFFKGISCIAVILIHCRFPGIVGGTFRAIARFAVPFFFSVSGYFLYASDQYLSIQTVRVRLKKTITLLVSAELFYVLYYIVINVCISRVSFNAILENFTMSKLMRLIIDNSPMLYPHLWYVFALIYCYVFIAFIEFNGHRWRNLYCIIAFGYYILFSEILPKFGIYDTFTSWQISIHNTFFVRALPFVFLGAIIREYENEIRKVSISPIRAYVCFFTLCLTSVFERLLFSDSGVYLSSIALVLLFWIVSINKICRVNESIAFIGNRLSTTVYIVHIAVMNTLDMVYLSFGIEKNPVVAWIRPVAVIFLSLILSFLLYVTKKNINRAKNNEL